MGTEADVAHLLCTTGFGATAAKATSAVSHPLREQLTFLLHGHFLTIISKVLGVDPKTHLQGASSTLPFT